MTGVLKKTKRFGEQTSRGEGRDGSDAFTSQESPAASPPPSKLGKRLEQVLLQNPQEEPALPTP